MAETKLNIIQTLIRTPGDLAHKLSSLGKNQRVFTKEQIISRQLADSGDNAVKKDLKGKKGAGSVGITATRMWGDVFNEEFISDLKGYVGAVTYEKMLRSDYQIGLLEESIMGIIKAAHYSFSIPDVPKGDKHAELCQWQWDEGLDKSPDENLNDLGSNIFFGNAVFEPVDYESYKHPKFGLVWKLRGLGFRDQTSITEWHFENGSLAKVHQQTYYSTPVVDTWIPAENLMILSEKRRGANYEGLSMLRKAYGPWWRKNVYYKLLSIGLEKASLGLIVITVPPGKLGTDEETAFIEAVQNYVTHENAYLKKTGTYNNDKFEGFDIEIVSIDFKADAVTNAIKLEDTNIAKCGAAAFSELGQGGNGGAYNLGVADIDFFFSMVTGRLKYICEKTSRIWKDLIIYNFGEQAEYPKLKAELESKAGEEFARTLNYFYNMGVYTPQPDDEEYIRKKYNMPVLKIKAASEPKDEDEETMPPVPSMPGREQGDADDEGAGAAGDGEEKPVEGEAGSDGGEAGKPGKPGKGKMSLSKQDPKYVKAVIGPVPLKAIRAELEELTDGWNKDIRSALQAVQDKYLCDIENKLKHNPNDKTGAVANIELGFTNRLKEVITDGITASMKAGKTQGRQILKIKKKNLSLQALASVDDFLPKNRSWIKSTTAVTVKVMTDSFAKEGILAVKKAIDQGATDAAVLFAAREALDNWKSNDNNLGAGAIIPTALDVGKDEAYENAGVSITGWLYVNDDPETAICQWLDGRAAREGDPDIEQYSPPNHWSCKSIKVPIMSDEEQPAEWDGWNVPVSVLAQQETLSHEHNHDIPAIWRGVIRKAA